VGGVFSVNEIFYLDNQAQSLNRGGRKFYQSSYANAPFGREFFDVLFYSDAHASLEDFRKMLSQVKRKELIL
jgi:hypothetical protein